MIEGVQHRTAKSMVGILFSLKLYVHGVSYLYLFKRVTLSLSSNKSLSYFVFTSIAMPVTDLTSCYFFPFNYLFLYYLFNYFVSNYFLKSKVTGYKGFSMDSFGKVFLN